MNSDFRFILLDFHFLVVMGGKLTNVMLTLKYRPQSLADITGQRHITAVISRMIQRHSLPPSLLFTGPKGTGKTSLARILLPPDHTTTQAIIELDAASHGAVVDIRHLTQELTHHPINSPRLLILDEVQSFSPQAFNALLAFLECPPPDTTTVLITTTPKSIPETVLSRCLHFEFTLLLIEDILARLAHIATIEHIEITPADLTLIARQSNGSLRSALMILDAYARSGPAALDLLTHPDAAPALLTLALTQDIPAALTLARTHTSTLGTPQAVAEALTAALRDVLVVRCGGHLDMAEEATQQRVVLARSLDTERCMAGLRLLWDLRCKTQTGENPALALELAVVLLCEVLISRPLRDMNSANINSAGDMNGSNMNSGTIYSDPNSLMTLDQLREQL